MAADQGPASRETGHRDPERGQYPVQRPGGQRRANARLAAQCLLRHTQGRKPTKADLEKAFPTPNARTREWAEDAFSLSLDGRTLHWTVPENNHAREHAEQTHLMQAALRHLAAVEWTRGSGGVIVGNDDPTATTPHSEAAATTSLDRSCPRGGGSPTRGGLLSSTHAQRAAHGRGVEKWVATFAATMINDRTTSPHTVAAAVIGGAALAGAVVGWSLMRVTYRLDRFAAPDGAGDPIWALTWTNASFPFTTVAIVVVAFTAAFACLATALIATRQTHDRAVARQRRIVAAGARTPLMRRPHPTGPARPERRGAHR